METPLSPPPAPAPLSRPRPRRPAGARPAATSPLAIALLRPIVPLPLILGAVAFELSLLLTPHVPGIGDAAEFTLALALGGVPHPTGYPWYVMLGTPFVRALHALGLGWVHAAGVWSALGAALATGLFAGLVQHLATLAAPARRDAWTVALPVLVLAFHPVWLRAATEPEVYSWWFAALAGAMWFTFSTVTELERGRPGPVPVAGIGWRWGLIAGACFLQHALSLLFVVPLTLALVAALRSRGALRASFALALLLGALIPFAGWGFLAWRAFHPAAYQWPLEASLASVWAHVRGAAYAGYLGGSAPNPAERALLARTLLPIVIPGLALGTLAALREPRPTRRGAQLALVLGAALLLAFTLNYRVPDPAQYVVPVLMVSLLWLPGVLARMAGRIPQWLAGAAVLVAGVAMASWGVRATLEHRARLERIDTRIRAAWHSIPFERGVVIWNDDHAARLVLLQLLERDHTERLVMNPSRLSWPAERRRMTALAGFDPLEGLTLRTTDDLTAVPDHVRGLTTLPVVEFPSVLGHETGPR